MGLSVCARDGAALVGDRVFITDTPEWTRRACVLDVPAEAATVSIGTAVFDKGELCWADLHFDVVAATVPVTSRKFADAPVNLGFSARRSSTSEAPDNCPIDGWGMTGSHARNYRAELGDERYESKPVVRMWRTDDGTDGFGAMCQMFKADSYRRRRVRFSAALRASGEKARAALCLRVDGPDTFDTFPAMLAFDNMHNRMIQGTTPWARYACVVDVPQEAAAIFVSNILEGPGELYWADVRFEVVDDTVPVTYA